MSKNEALRLLGVPTDRADDIAFIEAQYKMLKQQTTPGRELPPSPLLKMINQGLADIDKAYVIAITGANT